MELRVETEQEADGRWIAEVIDLPGAMAYGPTREEALSKAVSLAFRVLAERVEHHEVPSAPMSVSFLTAA